MAFTSVRDGARHGELLRALGMSRSALGQCLVDLAAFGWIMRNPGHGHPLRPEYVQTGIGRPIGAWCANVIAEQRRLGLPRDKMGRWTLPLVARIDEEWWRFSSLSAELAPITPRALSMSLKQLVEIDLVERRIESAFPPVPLSGLTARGRALAHAVAT